MRCVYVCACVSLITLKKKKGRKIPPAATINSMCCTASLESRAEMVHTNGLEYTYSPTNLLLSVVHHFNI